MIDKTAVKEVIDKNTIRIPGEVLRIVLCEKFGAPPEGSELFAGARKIEDDEIYELVWQRHRVAIEANEPEGWNDGW